MSQVGAMFVLRVGNKNLQVTSASTTQKMKSQNTQVVDDKACVALCKGWIFFNLLRPVLVLITYSSINEILRLCLDWIS